MIKKTAAKQRGPYLSFPASEPTSFTFAENRRFCLTAYHFLSLLGKPRSPPTRNRVHPSIVGIPLYIYGIPTYTYLRLLYSISYLVYFSYFISSSMPQTTYAWCESGGEQWLRLWIRFPHTLLKMLWLTQNPNQKLICKKETFWPTSASFWWFQTPPRKQCFVSSWWLPLFLELLGNFHEK